MQPSIKAIRASDGSGNASVATIQSVRSPEASTISVDTTQGWPDEFYASMGTPHTFVDPITAETITVISEDTAVDFRGHIDGSNLEIDEIAPGMTDNGSLADDIVIIKPITPWADNVADVLDVAHNDDGSLKAVVANQGWTGITGATLSVSSGYNKGNKEFDLTSDTDLTSVLSAGMRLKLTRGTTAPTQCTDLEKDSSQYASKSSPTGITFTDDFTCEAWIKLESYGTAGTIVARRNAGTEGFQFRISTTGQLTLVGLRIASNNRLIDTYQSVPLGRWVHVAATMDNSTNTHTMYIDGVSVPFATTTTGTITAIVQGGDLTVGAYTGGTDFFDGKIADVRVWSAIRTATQIRDNMNQQLVGNESNLVAYFKLNGNLNDSTANANNLTGSGGAVATDTDNPMKDTEYAIITNVTASTITVFTGTDHNIPNMTLSSPYYSTQKAPFGFPAASTKWRVETVIASDQGQTNPVSGTVYNVGSTQISAPIGEWEGGYEGTVIIQNAAAAPNGLVCLSTANNTFSDTRMLAAFQAGAASVAYVISPVKRVREYSFSATTVLYLNAKSNTAGATNIGWRGTNDGYMVLALQSAYV